MRGDRFGNIATLMRPLASLLYGEPADVVADSIARKEPLLGLVHSPPVLKNFEQLWGKHDVAISEPLCCLPTYVALDSQTPRSKDKAALERHISNLL